MSYEGVYTELKLLPKTFQRCKAWLCFSRAWRCLYLEPWLSVAINGSCGKAWGFAVSVRPLERKRLMRAAKSTGNALKVLRRYRKVSVCVLERMQGLCERKGCFYKHCSAEGWVNSELTRKETPVWDLTEIGNHIKVKYHHRESRCSSVIIFKNASIIVDGSDDSPCSVFIRWKTPVRIFGSWMGGRGTWRALVGGCEKKKQIELLSLRYLSRQSF